MLADGGTSIARMTFKRALLPPLALSTSIHYNSNPIFQFQPFGSSVSQKGRKEVRLLIVI